MTRLRVWSLAAVLLLRALPLAAQAPVSVEELAILQSLSPEERAALLEAITGGIPSTLSTSPVIPGTGLPAAPLAPGTVLAPEEEVEELRIVGADTIVVDTRFREDVDSDDEAAFLADVNRARLLGRRALTLTKDGVLDLPGIARIPLAGLSAEEVGVRLASEPLLAPLEVTVTILPLTPIGAAALKPFGYSLFDSEQDPFGAQLTLYGSQPPPLVPVPRDYVIGPGDKLRVQLYGAENYEVSLPVMADGTINFPKTGPRTVAGLTFGELKDEIEERVAEQLIGTQVAITLAELRSIRVFVVGDVKRPGAYTLSGLARVTNALFAAGGITEVGSLRRIEVKREGRLLARLDLYALLLAGDSGNDVQLQSSDVVLVPPSQFMVGVDGEVKRPAIYELAGERTVGELVRLAGDFQPTADKRRISVERVAPEGLRRIQTLDGRTDSGLAATLQAGDLVLVPAILDDFEGAVAVSGHVTRPGRYEWSPGMRLSQVLPSEAYLKPKADLGYVLVRREQGPARQVSVVSADLGAARAAPGGAADIALQPRDEIIVFEVGVARSAAVSSILAELEAQSTRDAPPQVVRVGGQVRAPGSYPLERNMRVSDLLRAGGGLSAAAYGGQAELTRFAIGPDGTRETQLIELDLERVRAGDPAADLALAAYDTLNVKEVPEWEDQVEVELLGEVRFPGRYPVRRGESLSSALERAGGLTELAFPEGAVFTRRTLQEREAQQIETLARRLEADLTSLAIQGANQVGSRATQALGIGQSLLEQLRSSTPTGRLVIDLPAVVAQAGDPNVDIFLKDGDKLIVPAKTQEVTVLGEVQYATSHLYEPGLARDSYIGLSGGLTANADPKRVYVVRANGAVIAASGSRWFGKKGTAINPGDTIVAPLDTTRTPQLQQWSAITQIIYNLAIAVAAVNSF